MKLNHIATLAALAGATVTYAMKPNDSIHNFLSDYAKKNNYDMILFKSATGYINPSFEVTDEVIEGLNKRYTKVAKK